MQAKGYVIARNRKVDQFFTTRSAYDRPQWIALSEATVYSTPEMAQAAWTKLAKLGGAYESRVVSVTEAIELSMPQQPTKSADPGMEVDFEMNSDGNTEMVASEQEPTCDACDHCPCTCDDTPGEDVEDIVDDMIGNDGSSPALDDTNGELGSKMSDAGIDLARQLPPGHRRGMAESTMPAKPPLDTPSTENSTTAPDLKAPEVIKFKQPAHPEDGGEKKPVMDTNETALKVPADVISELKACIDKHNKEAESKNTYDDTRASFCKTVAGAAEELLVHLEKGTVEGMKMAQVHLTRLMSPISSCLPTSVLKCVQMGGRKPSLKEMFDTKREETKIVEGHDVSTLRQKKADAQKAYEQATRAGNGAMARHYSTEVEKYTRMLKSKMPVKEAVNHMGDNTQSTYAGWKRACKAKHPQCWFEGDADIGQAFVGPKPYVKGETKAVGEWDGAEGSVYK